MKLTIRSNCSAILFSILFLLIFSSCATTPDESDFVGEPALNSVFEADLASQPREIPRLNGYPLLPPDLNYRYFEGITRFPFEPHAQAYSEVNAWILSDAAFLSYAHPGFARLAYELAGFDGFHFILGKSMECMVAWNDCAVIISFRGTELNSYSTLGEVLTDLDVFPTSYTAKAYVHKGFYEAFNSIWQGKKGLKEFIRQLQSLDPTRPVWITGHSLGGALATLCFAELPQAEGCYIYGAPRVGNSEFVQLLEGRTIVRFEYGNDPVTKVPLDVPALGFRYADSGALRYIDVDGVIYDSYPWLISGSLKKPAAKNQIGLQLEDHMPINYSVCLWNALLESN